jgi:hypothetical protein
LALKSVGRFTTHQLPFLGLIIRRSLQTGVFDTLIPDLLGKPILLASGNFQSLQAPEHGPDDEPWPEFIQQVLLSPAGLDDSELEPLIEVDPTTAPLPWSAKLLDRKDSQARLSSA